MPFDGTNYTTQDEVLALLKRARERVARPGGWCRGHTRVGQSYCSIGAIDYSAVTMMSQMQATAAVFEALPADYRSVIDCMGGAIIAYNDAPGRTQVEVVALFDRAIAKREAKAR